METGVLPRIHEGTSRATISDCLRYRYTLDRDISLAPGVRLCWIMLNPSTADHIKDDATIRKCIKFTRRLGFTGLSVVNLFAYRTKSPKELLFEMKHNGRAFVRGPNNDDYIREVAARCGRVICAWGAHAPDWRVRELADILGRKHGPFWCLGTTKDGAPRHPLYLADDTAVVNWGML